MLDSEARKYAEPFIDLIARKLKKFSITADQVTITALITGLFSAFLVTAGLNYSAIIVLWISGLLDAVDGSLARKNGSSSHWGTLLDITSDRIVEISIIISLALRNPEAYLPLILLLSSIIFSITVFLTAGSLIKKRSMKSFYYQPGLAERTEGFIMFSLMILSNDLLIPFTLIFTGMIIFTGCQRLSEARKIMKNEKSVKDPDSRDT